MRKKRGERINTKKIHPYTHTHIDKEEETHFIKARALNHFHTHYKSSYPLAPWSINVLNWDPHQCFFSLEVEYRGLEFSERDQSFPLITVT